jgi:gamma-glutamyltranspeptidase/glutathione hydrolase
MAQRLPRPPASGTRLAVAAGHPLAVSAALRIGAAGGNAADAAAAAAAACAVALPNACGVAGDALLLVSEPSGKVTAVNGAGVAPAGVQAPVPHDGGATVAVPGFISGLAELSERWGRLGLGAALEPAGALARDGVPAGARVVAALHEQLPRLLRGGAASSPWLPGDRPAQVGDVVRQPALAESLETIAARGAAGFYHGELAASIERAVKRDGGALTRRDLEEHTAAVRSPVSASYRGARIHVQPPSSQALLLAMALIRLDRDAREPGAHGIHRAVEALLGAFAHRDEIAVDGAEDRLLAAAAELPIASQATGAAGPVGYNHTTAVCTADADGLVVSMLVSVFDDFGAATWVPEGGMFLNDRLLGTSADPESPNHVAPGRRPVHTLSPALLEFAGTVTGLATPGADGQVQTLLQIIGAVVDDGAPLEEALDRPRWRSQDRALLVEADFDPDVREALAGLGHRIEPRAPGDGLFGAACAAGCDPDRGTVTAWADPRRDTAAGAW